jgi:hypothetical protein
MRLTVPPDWRLTLFLAGIAVGLIALLVLKVAKRYPFG